MILFTSDLDRTLIYSQRMLEMFPPATAPVIVEHKGNEAKSRMTDATVPLLQQVHQQTLFVPVTTRALHQYKRIHFIAELCPAFAITSNGGTILEKGQPSEKWAALLAQRIEDSSIPREDMLKHFDAVKSDIWLQRSLYIDNLFYVHHVDIDVFQQDELQAMIQEFDAYGWSVLLQGTKLYIMPKVLTKEAAIEYIKQFCTYDMHIAAGDSMMDYGMLAMADVAFTPYHGDLKDKQPAVLANTTYSTYTGEAFTKNLLETVLQLAVKQTIV
ncbi:HAD family hydrolase [Lysinibacillus sp. FSL K6-0232]|uniref:HAD family hydrolase n=1 Tax=unclassified Lysinibacillus TaxID=2636778 RepID=UPI0030F8C8AA